MSKYRGTPELEAIVEAWYADESDSRQEPILTYDPDYPAIALYIDIRNEDGEWEQLDNDLWEDEVRALLEAERYSQTAEGMWRE